MGKRMCSDQMSPSLSRQDGAFVTLLEWNSCVADDRLTSSSATSSCDVTCDVGEKIEEREGEEEDAGLKVIDN